MPQLKLSSRSWTSQRVFILAAIGSAVGLGNLWKFPYITGENGGGAFVLVYLACIVLIGLPILIAELTLGRAGQASPPIAMEMLAQQAGKTKAWRLLGFNGVLGGVLILSFYTVIGGWGLAYFFDSLMGQFISIDAQGADRHFSILIGSNAQLIFWHSIILLTTVWIVSKGVRAGLEKAINFMMPGLFLILIILLFYALTTGAFLQSFEFLFAPDFSKLSWNSVLVALGHAFFTLSLGFGTMMVYGSYIPKQYSIVRAALWIVVADTVIALTAGLVIFSIVFGNGLAASSGPGLLFQTLPIAFGQMPGGWLFGTLFFGLVVLAALSSSISMIEPGVSWIEQRWQVSRAKAAWILGLIAWLLGFGTIWSFTGAVSMEWIGSRNFFESVDFLTANIILPLGGLFTAVFVGWVWGRRKQQQEIPLPAVWQSLFGVVIKWIAPSLVALVFVVNLMQ